jgi:hypothetical protein
MHPIEISLRLTAIGMRLLSMIVRHLPFKHVMRMNIVGNFRAR